MSGTPSDLWVFGYGSLMWRPSFPYVESAPARLSGWRRRFCIISRYYRGSDVRPGLVLGLDRGGVCDGRVFRVAREAADEVLSYLRAREQISGVYREAHVEVQLLDGTHARRWAVTFIAEPAHPSFAPRLQLATQAAIIAAARGQTGTNLDYFLETLSALRGIGIREPELERLCGLIGPIKTRLPGRRPAVRMYPIAIWPRRPVRKLADAKRFIHRRRRGVR